ncbi:PHP domain-containing protein [Moraxella nasovis]|uniref:PHP domain-containing protein n=1 Tax=Moraxella nasovis TaxID=2904121 RepID=UPI001F61D720|nr:PHP domain-containing protein [Moraxella nasovis]UNU73763.1 PHP domain-containing protein [Moraxella nasovis]
MKYDLHSHSTCSDGTYPPDQLIHKASLAGITMFALTDHDTVSGLCQARSTAESLGVQFINGVEISCTHALSGGYGKHKQINQIIHVVALDFDDVKQMDKALQALQESRHNRGFAIIQKLGQLLGANNADHSELTELLWQKVLVKTDGNPQAVGRAHIAQVLYELGFVPTIQSAFDKYLADGKAAYVAIDAMNMEQAIALIHQCGGLAVLAHPTRYGLSATRTRRLIEDFANLKGDACELPNGEPDSLRAMVDRSIASHGLLVSVGSDFHGENMPWRKIGSTSIPKPEQIGVWEKFGAASYTP